MEREWSIFGINHSLTGTIRDVPSIKPVILPSSSSSSLSLTPPPLLLLPAAYITRSSSDCIICTDMKKHTLSHYSSSEFYLFPSYIICFTYVSNSCPTYCFLLHHHHHHLDLNSFLQLTTHLHTTALLPSWVEPVSQVCMPFNIRSCLPVLTL